MRLEYGQSRQSIVGLGNATAVRDGIRKAVDQYRRKVVTYQVIPQERWKVCHSVDFA